MSTYSHLCDDEAATLLIIDKYQEMSKLFPEKTKYTTYNIKMVNPKIESIELFAKVVFLLRDQLKDTL